jgi:hypothetical protein
MSNPPIRFVSLPDGRVCAVTRKYFGEPILAVLGTGEEIPLADVYEGTQAHHGSGEYPVVYSDYHSLSGYTTDGRREILLDWDDYDIPHIRIIYCSVTEDWRVLVVRRLWSDPLTNEDLEEVAYEFIVLSPGNEAKQEPTLTFAIMGGGTVSREIIFAYNRANPDRRIDIIDYAYSDSMMDFDGAEQRFEEAIISRNPPDVFRIDSEKLEKYTEAGYIAESVTYEVDANVSYSRYVYSTLAISSKCRDIDAARELIELIRITEG